VSARADRPLWLRRNAGDLFVDQDPGTAQDTPEGRDFNRKRDLDILQRPSWPPGIILPARIALLSVLQQFPTAAGICAYDAVTSPAWQGCGRASRRPR